MLHPREETRCSGLIDPHVTVHIVPRLMFFGCSDPQCTSQVKVVCVDAIACDGHVRILQNYLHIVINCYGEGNYGINTLCSLVPGKISYLYSPQVDKKYLYWKLNQRLLRLATTQPVVGSSTSKNKYTT